MSARLYPNAVELFIDDSVAEWTTYEVRALLLSQGYTYNPAHVFRDEIAPVHVIAESDPLEGATYDDGLAAGQPFSFLQLLAPHAVHSAVIYADTGDPAYSPLIAFFSAPELIGAPFVPLGQDYFIYPTTPPGGFFSLVSEPLIGPLNTYPLGGPYSIATTQGGVTIDMADLIIGGRLVVSDRICAPPVEIDSCCRPVFRGSRCE